MNSVRWVREDRENTAYDWAFDASTRGFQAGRSGSLPGLPVGWAREVSLPVLDDWYEGRVVEHPTFPLVWLNGEILPAEDALISVTDHGFVVGDGVFETVLITNGYPFALRRHLSRLLSSALQLGIGRPDVTCLTSGVRELIAANECEEGALRIIVTPGPGPVGSQRRTGPHHTAVLILSPLHPPAHQASAVVCPWARNENGVLTGLKTTSYAENACALAWAIAHGASEALFANTKGMLCEGSGTNIFLGIDGELITPPVTSGCLPGITRSLLLEHLDVIERDVPVTILEEPDTVQEAFLTSSLRLIRPLERIGDHVFLGDPGPLSARASECMEKLLSTRVE
jgi:branched-chain amino acid aminotransferase